MLEHVWEKHQNVLRAIAVSIVTDTSTAEDVLQDAFAKVVRSRKRFRSDVEAFQFVRRAVFNASLDRYRVVKRFNRRFHSVETLGFETYPEPVDNLDPLQLLVREEELGQRRDLMREVRSGLKDLKKEQRQAISLIFDSNGKSIKQTCREVGTPYSTVRSRMLAGLDALRQILRQKGLMAGREERPE